VFRRSNYETRCKKFVEAAFSDVEVYDHVDVEEAPTARVILAGKLTRVSVAGKAAMALSLLQRTPPWWAAERVLSGPLGQEVTKLFPDGLDDVWSDGGLGMYSFCSGSVWNSPDDGVSVPALHTEPSY
jgi:hypothetical protein